MRLRRATSIEHCINITQRCFDVALTSDFDGASTLRNVKITMSNFVSYSTPDQRCFIVELQRWNNLDLTFKSWLSWHQSIQNWQPNKERDSIRQKLPISIPTKILLRGSIARYQTLYKSTRSLMFFKIGVIKNFWQ